MSKHYVDFCGTADDLWRNSSHLKPILRDCISCGCSTCQVCWFHGYHNAVYCHYIVWGILRALGRLQIWDLLAPDGIGDAVFWYCHPYNEPVEWNWSHTWLFWWWHGFCSGIYLLSGCTHSDLYDKKIIIINEWNHKSNNFKVPKRSGHIKTDSNLKKKMMVCSEKVGNSIFNRTRTRQKWQHALKY